MDTQELLLKIKDCLSINNETRKKAEEYINNLKKYKLIQFQIKITKYLLILNRPSI